MAHFNVYLVLGLDAKLLLLGLVFIIGQNYAVDVQKCGIDEYFQRDLEMCKPCTEVCRPGDRSCEKICPCFVIQKKLKEGLRNYKLLQTQNSELAASKEILQKQNSELAASKEILQKQNSELAASKERWRLAVILISTLFAMFILAAGIIWKLWMPKKQSEHNGRRPQPAEENNVTSRFAPSGKAPPSPDVVPDNECFPMLRLNREEGSEQQRDAGQRGDMDQQFFYMLSCIT